MSRYYLHTIATCTFLLSNIDERFLISITQHQNNMTTKVTKRQSSRVELQEAFKLFDKDGDGEVLLISLII